MKTLIFFAVVLAVGAQAREPENLAALVDEMAVLERVLGAALEGQTTGSAPDLPGVDLRLWFEESVRAIRAEYLAQQGILVSLELNRRPSVRELPNVLFTTLARTGEIRLPMLVASLEPGDFVELKRLVDEHDETRKRHSELTLEWHRELSKAHASGQSTRPKGSATGREVGALYDRKEEQFAAINAEIHRLRGLLVEPAQEASTEDIHAVLVQAVCDYAMLKSLPDDERLTLKVIKGNPHPDGRLMVRQWTYYVLAKRDVVECRQGTIDAEELRQRAYVYSRGQP